MVPAAPRTQLATSSSDWPLVSCSSTLTMTSLTLTPAFSAGLSLKTSTILGSASGAVLVVASIRTPIPTYEPESEFSRAASS